LIQNNDKLELHPRKSQYVPTTDSKFLLCFQRNEDGFCIQQNKLQQDCKDLPFEKTWLVIRNSQKSSPGYCLSASDQVRLGKVALKISEISPSSRKRPSRLSIQTKNLFQGGLSAEKSKKGPKVVSIDPASSEDEGNNCRICLSDENETSNPLVKPCKCSGSMSLVHVECLQKWFTSKVATRESPSSSSYSWKSLHCELCKFDYPEKVAVQGQLFDLLLLNKPKQNFIMFQTDQGSGDLNSVCIVSFNEKKSIRMGRAADCDVKLADISVSRTHAYLVLNDEGLFLKDFSSKFGTLVRVRQTLSLTPGVKFELQCGRNLVKIVLKKPFRFLSCLAACGRKKTQEETENKTKKRKKIAFEDTFNNQV
jgi:hypothetical protein